MNVDIDHGIIIDCEALGHKTIWQSPDREWQIDVEQINNTYEDGFDDVSGGATELWRRNPNFNTAQADRLLFDESFYEGASDEDIQAAYDLKSEWIEVTDFTNLPALIAKAWKSHR